VGCEKTHCDTSAHNNAAKGLSSELKKLMSSVCQYCFDAAINEFLIDENLPIEDFDKHFQEALLLLSNKMAPPIGK